MSHTTIIILIILGAGFLGGLTNFFRTYKIDYKKLECRINLYKSLSLGLCASVAVPLFLQVISNNLIDVQKDVPYPTNNYFILAGFCVLAAFFSKRFLENLYDKLSVATETAEEAIQIAERAEISNQEIDADAETIVKSVDEIILKKYPESASKLDSSEKEMLVVADAMINSKYSYRTIQGISKDTKLKEDAVTEILEKFKRTGYATKRTNSKGNLIWKMTDKI